ncbi:dephospho-CoA kinase [Hyphobacterium sp.]|uniref:dephospho-CoA kinase n=1 Tax=Hyphobacterium sp. TaxID=2004662 RepID=UPI003B52A730
MGLYKLGLTGSIGMGKSTTARMFANAGVPVFDSDAVVHQLYAPGGAAVAVVEETFPGVVKDGAISREKLSAMLSVDPSGFDRLNAIVHPLVAAARERFLANAAAAGHELVVFDIPLLFETGGDALVDGILVVTAPAEVQRSRVLVRPGMTEGKFAQILERQTPDSEKRQRADFLIDTSQGLEAAQKAVDSVIAELSARSNQDRT